MVGRWLGHYRLLEKLGAGGMGEVYLAEDLRLHRHVALKILPPERSAHVKSLERFQREARLVAALNHPNIVTIHSVEEHEGLHFLTMELVQGSTLAELIPPQGMPLRRILEIGIPLADALAAAHEQGIVHRDLKPANVMVSHEGRVKVLDFGIGIAQPCSDGGTTIVDGRATREEALTGTGLILGTPAYMSPEQVLGRPMDPRTDLFSLGAVLFQMATGRHPFLGNGSSETVAAILRDTPPRTSSLNPQVSPELDELIGRCLEKEPSRRVQSAHEISESLQALVTSPAASMPPLLPTVIPTRVRHLDRPATALVATACCVALGLAAMAPRLPRLLEMPLHLAPASAKAPNQRPGLAVLPLGNFSQDPEYFVDGMTDALIASLSDVQGVRVISRQSVMRFKKSSEPLPEIARKLDVDMIVQGSVMRVGNRVRITAQLVRAVPEQQIWGHSYERDFRDVLALQREVTAAISREIQVKLEPTSSRPAAAQPVDPEAYDAYLRGRFALNLRTKTGFDTALESFQEALRRDPDFALAHAGLAELYCLIANFAFADPAESYQQARPHARSALELDPELADARVSLGLVQLFADRDWDGAEKSFRQVLALHPSHPTAHNYYAIYLLARGRQAEATEQFRLHLELNPLSPNALANLGNMVYLEGRPGEALRLLRQAQALAPPDFSGAYASMTEFYRLQGDPEMDFRYFRKTLLLRYPQIPPAMDEANRKGGRRAALQAAAEALEKELVRNPSVKPSDIARVYVRLDEREKALDCLEESYRRGFIDALLIGAMENWNWNILRTEPRFRTLVQRARQSSYSGEHSTPSPSTRPLGCAGGSSQPKQKASTERGH